MKSAAVVALLLVLISGTLVIAQNGPTGSPDVTMAMVPGAAQYCKGQNIRLQNQNPDDIMLLLRLKLLYQNHRDQALLLPLGFDFSARVYVPGRSEAISERKGGGGAQGLDVKSLMAASRPTEGFLALPPRKDVGSK